MLLPSSDIMIISGLNSKIEVVAILESSAYWRRFQLSGL